MNYEEVLGELCALSGPSGFEGQAARAGAELLKPWMDEAAVDPMGNVVAVRRCGRPNAPKLLLDAHLDEIGFMITGHEDGYCRIAPLGGVDPRMLPDRELVVLAREPVVGVVACLPPHIQTQADFDRAIPIRELLLDVGMCLE